MFCRLCFTESNDVITIFKDEQIRKYIAKFLQLELTPEDEVSKVVCRVCWTQLNNFQIFCLRVEEAQKSVIAIREDLKKEDIQIESEETYVGRENTKSNFNSLQKEDIDDGSDGGQLSTVDAFRRLDDGKVEPSNLKASKSATNSLSAINEPFYRLRTTRQSKLNGRKDTSDMGVKKELDIHEQIGGSAGEDTTPDPNAKRRSDRPKKCEEPSKVQKVKLERKRNFLENTKELDEIIEKNMNLVCDMCSACVIDFSELRRHFRRIHNRKGYALCCNKKLFDRGLIVDHIRTHSNPEYFRCTECGKVMADRMCLRNHVLLMHVNEDDKAYQCPYCPKKFAKQYLLIHHQVKHIPQEECTFICTECNKGFPTNGTLTQHWNQIHSGVLDKMCEICAKIVRGNAAFDRHMEQHVGIVQPQVQCKICGLWLKNKNSLRMHMYKHDGKSYTCNKCGKIAPSKSALRSHYKYVHQTVRQFDCTYCDKSFKKAINLREHLTTHTGDVLYTCPHCPQTFNSRSNMHAHRKKKHPEEWKANRRCSLKRLASTETNSVLS